MATTITPGAAADALGISLWELAIAQSQWATAEIQGLTLDVTSNRSSTLEDFDQWVARARAHWAGALETMRAIEGEEG